MTQSIAVPIVPPGEDLCLDFANTRFWRGRAAPVETLAQIGDLQRWLEKSAKLPAPILGALAQRAADDPDGTDRLFSEAITLRETIYRIFAGLAADAGAAEPDLTLLNAALAAAPPRCQLVPAGRGYAWNAAPAAVSAPVVLAPVLWSAADLMTQIAQRRVRRCGNEECLWLFIDHSKGGTRRWCDMGACGNRAKARRHYARSKAAG